MASDAERQIHMKCPNCGKYLEGEGFHIRGQFCVCGWRRDAPMPDPRAPEGADERPVAPGRVKSIDETTGEPMYGKRPEEMTDGELCRDIHEHGSAAPRFIPQRTFEALRRFCKYVHENHILPPGEDIEEMREAARMWRRWSQVVKTEEFYEWEEMEARLDRLEADGRVLPEGWQFQSAPYGGVVVVPDDVATAHGAWAITQVPAPRNPSRGIPRVLSDTPTTHPSGEAATTEQGDVTPAPEPDDEEPILTPADYNRMDIDELKERVGELEKWDEATRKTMRALGKRSIEQGCRLDALEAVNNRVAGVCEKALGSDYHQAPLSAWHVAHSITRAIRGES